MKFKEGYNLTAQGVKGIKVPFCNEHKDNLYEELYNLESRADVDQSSLEYYKLYLESCGDLDKPKKPFICYQLYYSFYAKIFESDLRRNMVNREDVNHIYCEYFNIPKRYENKTFEKIKEVPEQTVMVNAAKNWIKDGWKNSLTLGSISPGVGKTNTAVCCAFRRFVDFDFVEIKRFEGPLKPLNSSIIFLKERELFNMINLPGVYKSLILDRLAAVDFLVYDDMFSVADETYTREIIMDLIDRRIDSDVKPTVITTRIPDVKMKEKHPDIYSRLKRGKYYYSSSKTDLRINGKV